MTYWIEVRPWQQRTGRPRFVELDEIGDGYRGFRSVYAYPDDVMQRITEQRGTAELGGVVVYSDVLFFDFDDTDPSDVLLYLYDEGIAHEVYVSGNRSVHIHVRIEPMTGPDVPYSQKMWVLAHTTQADCTFYHAAGQFRLTGTIHEKTGKKKELIRSMDGADLVIPYQSPPPVAYTTPGKLIDASPQFMTHLLRTKTEPGRRVYAWHLAMQAHQEGYAFEDALDKVLWWNRHYSVPPLPTDAVLEKVQSVYKKRSR
jgi:hypothetical protein